MPTVRKTLIDKAWAILEADAGFVALYPRLANRARPDVSGWLRESMASSPVDFRLITIDLVRGRHSMYTRVTAFCLEDPDYGTRVGDDFDVERTSDLVITLRSELDKKGDITAPEEEVIDSFFKAGIRFGLPALVVAVGEATFDRRETRTGEKPYPGTVTTIRLPLTTRESGRALLAIP